MQSITPEQGIFCFRCLISSRALRMGSVDENTQGLLQLFWVILREFSNITRGVNPTLHSHLNDYDYLLQGCSNTYTLVSALISSSNTPAGNIFRGLLNSVLKMIRDQTLEFFITVLKNSLVFKQISYSIHFASALLPLCNGQLSTVVNGYEASNIKIYIRSRVHEYDERLQSFALCVYS